MVVNGGFMPVWEPALTAAGLTANDLNTGFHVLLPTDPTLQFFLQAGPIGDLIPIPLPLIANVASVGDAFIATGLAWFIFATMVRPSDKRQPHGIALGRGTHRTQTTVDDATGFERPVMLGGGGGSGLSSPFGLSARVKGHPYTRLAHDPRFAAYWVAQTISLFGDRLHQVALAVLVYSVTDSPLATGLVFLAATLPNIFLGPIAGTFVDRWEHKRVMIASDLIRAALVIAIPYVATVNIVLVYPLVFVITAVSLFFRPAKVAFLPRIVKEDDIMPASSATWTADTLADIVGFPIAGLFVAFLGAESSQLAIAFFADSATYVLSAILLATITVAPLVRDTLPQAQGAVRAFVDQLTEGWRFLRTRAPLIQNTIISAIAQMMSGVTLALMVVYARDTLDGQFIPYPQNYAAIDTAIGIGNLVGGLAVGIVGARFKKGWLVVGGFIVMGGATVILGLTSNIFLALVAATVVGIANLVYIIPTQTIFIEITPIELMGRVVAFRSTLVYGAMTLAMAVSGIFAESLPVGVVIAAFGALTLFAGVVGALLPAVRDPQTKPTPAEIAEPALQ
jgi:MFS family permease